MEGSLSADNHLKKDIAYADDITTKNKKNRKGSTRNANH